MPVCTNVRNPGNVASSLYGPTGKFGRMYAPVSLLTAVRLTPVSVCVAVISAPGKTAPLESVAVPLICAVACAHPSTQLRTEISNAKWTYLAIRFILPPTLHELKIHQKWCQSIPGILQFQPAEPRAPPGYAKILVFLN